MVTGVPVVTIVRSATTYVEANYKETDLANMYVGQPAEIEIDAYPGMKLHGRERIRTAMDPFLGLGSSAVAALRLDADFIGVEIDGHYLAESIHRLTEELNERGLFDTGARRRRRPRLDRRG